MDGLPARPKARPRANATGVMRRRDNAKRTVHLRLGGVRSSAVFFGPMRAADQTTFEDSDFDWDTLATRSPARRDPADPVMGRLAWVVLVLLSFGPPLGFALATVWR